MVADYQFEYDGVTYGDGTSYEIISVAGLYARNVSIVSNVLPRYHGAIIGASYHAPRTIDFTIEAVATPGTVSAMQEQVAALRDAALASFQPLVDTEVALSFKVPGQAARRVYCRPASLASDINVTSEFGVAVIAVQLVASDPAIYLDAQQQVVLTPFAPSAGLSYPETYPKAYGAAGTGVGSTAANQGAWETWPEITIAGPSSGTLTNPVLENVTTGKSLSLSINGGVSISTGQSLVIKMHPKDRSILFTTGASRYGNATGDFWPLQPGNNELVLRASGTTTGATATVIWRSAWI